MEVDVVFTHYNIFGGNSSSSFKPPKIEEVRVYSKIYTDGEIIEILNSEPKEIDEYKIGNFKYEYPVDTLIKQRIHIKNANYILAVTVAKENIRLGTTGRMWANVIKDSEIFLNNKKDKKALKNAKKTLMSIKGPANPQTTFEALFGNINQYDSGLKYEPIKKHIFQLKKEK